MAKLKKITIKKPLEKKPVAKKVPAVKAAPAYKPIAPKAAPAPTLAQKEAFSTMQRPVTFAPMQTQKSGPLTGTVKMPIAKDHSGSQPGSGSIDMNEQLKKNNLLAPSVNPFLNELRRHEKRR